MRLSLLQEKSVISIKTGKNMGKIIDVIINDDGYVISFIIEEYSFFKSLFKSNNEINIKVSEIVKIGTDVILVNV